MKKIKFLGICCVVLLMLAGCGEKDSAPRSGILNYNDGAVYRGEIKEGKPNGQGTYTYPNGDVCKGEFKDDLFDG